MSEQPINQWNMTTEPSDMMKINTPMPITVAPSPSNQMEVIDDDSFSYDGYQVVRGEFFAHIYEPSFTFNNYKVSVNTACIKKLPDVEYVQILVNPIEKKLAVRPCREEEKDSFRWCSSGKKRSPKQITCRIFFAKVISLMDWNPNYRYKILGKLIRSGNEILFIFDLTSPEIFPRTLKDNGTVTTARTPSYPEEWKNQFGIPVEEHQKSMQVNIFEGYLLAEKIEHLSYHDMKRELLWNNYAKPILKKESSVSIPSIRNLPQFDPDAEIASLTLTIPSWNSSIERVLKVSDFKIASDTAKYKLKYQLMCLISTTNNILKKLEEI